MQATVKYIFHNSSKCILRLHFQKHTWTKTHYYHSINPHLSAHYIRPRKACVFHKKILDKPSLIIIQKWIVPNNLPFRHYSYSSGGNHILSKYRESSDADSFLNSNVYLTMSKRGKTEKVIESTVKALKEEASKPKDEPVGVFEVKKELPPAPATKSLGQRIVEELKHYYHGFRLLFIDLKVCTKLCWKVMLGYHLSRREHKLLIRTTADLFRLIPFSVFLIVPFMEFTLPFFLWLFPGMMPSTFQSKDSKDVKTKKELKLKLEMAKFLHDTLDAMSLQAKGHDSELAQQFHQFCDKVRNEGRHVSNEEILKFSKLFEDELTLDNLSKEQLVALCRLLELQPIGTSKFLNFQLRMRLRNLKADDRVIKKEGLENMTIWEIQQACKARGMRSVGLTEDRLRSQLEQWLELSLTENIPPSLLLLSRALYMPDQIATAEQIAATISQLPQKIAQETEAKISEQEGKIDNKTRLLLIQEEEKRIRAEIEEEERLKKEEEEKKKQQLLAAEGAKAAADSEVLVDKAPVLKDVATPVEQETQLKLQDLNEIEQALGELTSEKKPLHLEKEELAELKEEMAEYKEDIEELKEVIVQTGRSENDLKESKAASRLSKKVDKMLNKLDRQISREEEKAKTEKLASPFGEKDKTEVGIITINELMATLKKHSKSPDNETRFKNISKILQDMDIDHDGNIKVDDVIKVLEVLENEQGTISTEHMKEIIQVVEKEENLEMVEKIEKVMHRDTKPASVPKEVEKPKLLEKSTPPPPLQ